MAHIKLLQRKLNKIELQLEKVRGCSPITHGWQTAKYAKASKKWDDLAKDKQRLQREIEEELGKEAAEKRQA